jgi:hypothetical protein
MNQYYEWGAVGMVHQRTGKFMWANPEDTYYKVLSFMATAFWDGHRWVYIMSRKPR